MIFCTSCVYENELPYTKEKTPKEGIYYCSICGEYFCEDHVREHDKMWLDKAERINVSEKDSSNR